MFRDRGLYHPAHMITQRGIATPIPNDVLFVHRWMYEWGMLFEHSIAAYWVGRPRAALEACNRLLKLPQLPEEFREQTKANRGYCIRALGAAMTGSTTPTRIRSRAPARR
jgi:hypothetical protein